MTDRLEEAKKIFSNDLFATETTGIEIQAADVNYAKCTLKLEKKHINAIGTPMGGAIYTLADFIFAIASNTGNVPTVTMTSEISFLKVAEGSILTGESDYMGEKGRDCFYNIDITDDRGTKVAAVKIKGRRIKKNK
ncbi:MAG: PaaI family thioesterase [Eubacteriaceae bacterium]|nr:PaaI family thioesterase [Eubacteriaceae bacterium]